MSNYTKATNFTAKDALLTGNPSKIVRGSEIDIEYDAIAVAIATKAEVNSPTFTGTVVLPNNTITAAMIQTDAVTTAKILDSNVTTAKIANDAVTTAKILDGNVTAAKLASGVSSVGQHTLYIPASAMVARASSGPTAGTVELPTNNIMLKTLDFDATNYRYAQFSVRMPKSWNEGTFSIYFLWSNASGTGNVLWGMQAVAISNDDVLDAAWGTAGNIVDSVTAAGDLMQSDVLGPITAGGTPAEADWVVFEVYRGGSHGSDTLAVDARLHGVVLIYTTNAATDA